MTKRTDSSRVPPIGVDKADRIRWPGNKDFAFTIFDDTDSSTLENGTEVYSLLMESGLRTTKSVWPIRGTGKGEPGRKWGSTCEDEDYLQWVKELQGYGFEIGYHSATFQESERSEVIRALERFNDHFGHHPITMAQHTYGEGESIYWGNHRLTGLNGWVYRLLTLNRMKGLSRGHNEGDRYFWGDLCKERIKYIRNFVYADINTLKACPMTPYHDPKTPYVNYWFASSEGPDVASFNRCISEKNQDRLEAEGGACIMYTHFANGFYVDGSINPRFRYLINRISSKNGWFVPVSDLLDYLLQQNGGHILTDGERASLGRKWLRHKLRVGTS